jgi:hypothetical protein
MLGPLDVQADCDTRECCWVGDNVTAGFCYHRLPSPYSLSIAFNSPGYSTGGLNGTGLLDGKPVFVGYKVRFLGL